MTGTAKTPWYHWLVAVLATLWNAGGVFSYMSTKLGALEGQDFPPEQLIYFDSFPAWAVAFWALGVWGCFFGSVALLLRTKWATALFGISLIGLLGTTIYQRVVELPPESMQTAGHTAFAVAIWVITIGLFFYSTRMTRAGVLK